MRRIVGAEVAVKNPPDDVVRGNERYSCNTAVVVGGDGDCSDGREVAGRRGWLLLLLKNGRTHDNRGGGSHDDNSGSGCGSGKSSSSTKAVVEAVG